MSSSAVLRALNTINGQAKSVLRHGRDALVTMYLFNKSDIKTIVFPITIFAQSLAQFQSWTRFALVVAWVWLELLEFTVSNQSFGNSPEEDALNKPYRPIPSKRMTLSQAKTLRLLLTPLNLVLACLLGTLPAAFGISLFTPAHNEGGGHKHWITKGGITAILYALFEMGATNIAGSRQDLSPTQYFAVLGSSLIIFTTIHAQDFRDMEGDSLEGRKTFPLVCPKLARWTMFTGPLFWACALCIFSQVHFVFRAAFVVEALVIGWRFNFLKTAEEHRRSYLHYNIWLCIAHVCLSSLDMDWGSTKLAQTLVFLKN